ncbi:uncharacterized protein CBL_03905 [Carabus blaptoides fortunei]
MESTDEYDAIQVNNQTWNKLRGVATKAGYREGITAGRDSNFQTSFDAGYSEGFKNGFALGTYKGVLSFTDSNQNELLVDKTARGNCIICKNKELENNALVDLIDRQTMDTNNILVQLCSSYSPSTKVQLSNKIN